MTISKRMFRRPIIHGRVIRMAELYLNLAEAEANLGNIDSAVEALKPRSGKEQVFHPLMQLLQQLDLLLTKRQ